MLVTAGIAVTDIGTKSVGPLSQLALADQREQLPRHVIIVRLAAKLKEFSKPNMARDGPRKIEIYRHARKRLSNASCAVMFLLSCEATLCCLILWKIPCETPAVLEFSEGNFSL